ncbi:MAG: TIGR01777 family oxidoreductase [Bacteroidota bacterium]
MTKTSANLPQRILITGGTGLVGTRLSELLKARGCEVTHLSRRPTDKNHSSFHWDVKKQVVDEQAIKEAEAIIHLAGASVAGKRWNENWKKEIYTSRIDSTRLLLKMVKEHNPAIKHFISASAIGYYGWDTGDKWVDEETPKGDGFLADVVGDWEQEVVRFKEIGVKNACLRVGIVLSKEGGALVEMAKPIKMGAGAALGSGKQYMSWIHLDDLCHMFIYILENELEGIYNGTSPNPVTNMTLTKQLAKALKRPLFLPNVPPFMLRLIVGEMATVLTGGNKVSSKKIEKAGFVFQHPLLHSTLKALY